jgi:hypothetical protein
MRLELRRRYLGQDLKMISTEYKSGAVCIPTNHTVTIDLKFDMKHFLVLVMTRFFIIFLVVGSIDWASEIKPGNVAVSLARCRRVLRKLSLVNVLCDESIRVVELNTSHN